MWRKNSVGKKNPDVKELLEFQNKEQFVYGIKRIGHYRKQQFPVFSCSTTNKNIY